MWGFSEVTRSSHAGSRVCCWMGLALADACLGLCAVHGRWGGWMRGSMRVPVDLEMILDFLQL